MQRSYKTRAGLRNNGVSLIEILVVIVILLVGILSVIRLFPAGFVGIRNAENNTIANGLGQAQLDPLRDNVSAPDGVYASVLTSPTTIGFDPTVDPDDFGPYIKSTPATLNSYSDDINKARYISREPITVPAAIRRPNGSFVSTYSPRFGPIYLPSGVYTGIGADSPAELPYLNVVSSLWRPTIGDWRNPDEPEALRSGRAEYLIDYAGGQIAIAPEPYPQHFTLSFQAIANGTVNIYFVDLNIPASTPTTPNAPNSSSVYNGGWFSPITSYGTISPGLGAGQPWILSSAALVRPFAPVAPGSFSADDPYQFAIVNPNLPGTDCNVGSIQFNSIAAAGDGGKAIQGFISYNTFDWHILREDHEVPGGLAGSEGGTVRLAISNLKRLGSIQYDQTTYDNIVPYVNGFTANDTDHYDIVMVDLDTGLQLTAPAAGSTDTTQIFDVDDQSGGPNTSPYWVSYSAGRVTFNNVGAAYYAQHRHVRMFYRGALDWGVALQRAAVLYTYSDIANLTKVPLAFGPNIYANDNAGHLYFPRSARLFVVHLGPVSYTDSTGVVQSFDTDQQVGSNGWLDAGNGLPYIDLSTLAAADAQRKNLTVSANKPITVGYVRGLSARSVVVWRSGDKLRVRTVDGILSSAQ